MFSMRPDTHRPGSDRLGRLGLLLFVCIAVLPIGFSLLYALAYSLGLVGLLSDGITLDHWRAVLMEGELYASFGLSLYVSTVTVLCTVTGALLLVLLLRKPLTTGPLSTLMYLPLAIPATVAAFLVFQLFSGAGLMARLALALGFIQEVAQFPELIQDRYGVGIILAHTGLAIPFFTLLFLQVYANERVETLGELAQTLGARPWQVTTRVMIPVLLKRSATNLLLLFIAVLGSYEIPLLLGRQAPEMVSVMTLRKYAMFDLANKPEAFIVALLYTSVVLLLMGLAYRRGRLTSHG